MRVIIEQPHALPDAYTHAFRSLHRRFPKHRLNNPASSDPDDDAAPAGARRLFAKGIGVSLLNPKVFLLFLALLPQFASTSAAWPLGAQMVGLGVIHVANCAVVYFGVGYGASAVLTRRPRAAKVVGIISGVVMIGLGLALVIEKIITALH